MQWSNTGRLFADSASWQAAPASSVAGRSNCLTRSGNGALIVSSVRRDDVVAMCSSPAELTIAASSGLEQWPESQPS
jgi:hypothetical protein